jgi:hemolysin activation/secretion protein
MAFKFALTKSNKSEITFFIGLKLNMTKKILTTKLGYLLGVSAFVMAAPQAWAQTANPAGDVLRNIEQNRPSLAPSAPKPAAKRPEVPATTDQGFARLKEIKVNSQLLRDELTAYWLSDLNKPVSAQKLADFKAFAWDLFQSKGYLAYINTSAQATPDGSVLTVNVTIPSVGKVTVVTTEKNKGIEYAEDVAARFSTAYPVGAPVDVLGFESQLNAITYDLPVDLEVSMSQVNDKTVDVVINLRPIKEVAPFSVLGGAVQANNYGLSQFGRAQVMGAVRVAGLTPLSEMSLITQLSEGVQYYRADYEAPIVGTGTRWKLYTTHVDSKATNVKGQSNEWGGALTKLISSDRVTRWLASTEASRGTTHNWSAGLETANRVDDQFRLRLRSESTKGLFDNLTNEFLLTAGRMDLSKFADDYTLDQAAGTGPHVAGTYQKFELRGGLSHALDNERQVTGSVRWRSQYASKNLDTANRLSLGGINGIRTLTSLDGVGDHGAQMSFDLVHQARADVYAGLFYDVGVIKPYANAITGVDNSRYTLQGGGYQIGGSISEVKWVMSVGRSFGKTPTNWTTANTPIGTTRVNFAATYAF